MASPAKPWEKNGGSTVTSSSSSLSSSLSSLPSTSSPSLPPRTGGLSSSLDSGLSGYGGSSYGGYGRASSYGGYGGSRYGGSSYGGYGGYGGSRYGSSYGGYGGSRYGSSYGGYGGSRYGSSYGGGGYGRGGMYDRDPMEQGIQNPNGPGLIEVFGRFIDTISRISCLLDENCEAVIGSFESILRLLGSVTDLRGFTWYLVKSFLVWIFNLLHSVISGFERMLRFVTGTPAPEMKEIPQTQSQETTDKSVAASSTNDLDADVLSVQEFEQKLKRERVKRIKTWVYICMLGLLGFGMFLLGKKSFLWWQKRKTIQAIDNSWTDFKL